MSDIKVNPWIAIVISVISLMISAATFAIQRITIRDFAYRVGHFNAQNLVGGTDQSNTAFSLQASFINDGNEPVIVNKFEVFVINKPRTLDVSDVRDFDCDRQHIIPYWEPLYLYEPTANIPQEGRGNATENSFGHKEVPAISVAPYSTVQDLHRFSLFLSSIEILRG